MKIEAGKKYKSRNGRIWIIYKESDALKKWDWMNALDGTGLIAIECGTENNKYPDWILANYSGEWELIEEVIEMKLEVGKIYLDRSNAEVKIVAYMSATNKYVGVKEKAYAAEYSSFGTSLNSFHGDLIKEKPNTVKVEGWFNVYRYHDSFVAGSVHPYQSKEKAKHNTGTGYLGTIHVKEEFEVPGE